MSLLSFDLAKLQSMLTEAENASQLTPTYDDLWNATLYQGGELLDEQGRTESEVVLSGDEFWPDWQQIQTNKIQPQLLLMAEGVHGIYIINNVGGEVSPLDRNMICFAKGFHPQKDKDQLSKQQTLFGKEGHAFVVPVQWLKACQQAGKRALVIQVKDAECELLIN